MKYKNKHEIFIKKIRYIILIIHDLLTSYKDKNVDVVAKRAKTSSFYKFFCLQSRF